MKVTSVFILLFCVGLSASDIAPFVVGGQNATQGQFKYMVSLSFINIPDHHECGGGILNHRWILSAAHCFMNATAEIIVARVGNVERKLGVTYLISSIFTHPRFVAIIQPTLLSSLNDIAVIKTTTLIVFNEFTQPIPLGRRFISSAPATVSGFGAFDPRIDRNFPEEQLVMADHLQYIDTRIISPTSCLAFATILNNDPSYPIRFIIYPFKNMCTMQRSGLGACFGDSGSLLISDGAVVGITIASFRSCARGAPDIYTRVSHYVSWIESVISDLS